MVLLTIMAESDVQKESFEPGMEKAWEALDALDPKDVCRRAAARYGNGTYMLNSLGLGFHIRPGERSIRGSDAEAESIRQGMQLHFDLAVLWYLVKAGDFGPTGRHLKPEQLKGGHHFFRGAHELPLKDLAARYGTDTAAFLGRGLDLGGRALSFGDASVELLPLPRIPVSLILWKGDDEFPSRADLLFDSSCEMHLPLDIIWSAAMLSVKGMLA